MTRHEFLSALRAGLSGLPTQSIDDIVADYEAHFTEGLAAGRTEAQVAGALGDPRKLARELNGAAKSGGWTESEWRDPNPAGTIFQSLAKLPYGVGWVLMALAVLAVISMLPVIISVVGAILGLVVVGAIVMAILAAVFGSAFWWRGGWSSGMHGPVDGSGAWVSRSFAWSPGDSLRVSAPAEVEYVQGPQVSLTISGAGRALDYLVVSGSDIRYDRWVRNAGKLKIVLTAPDVSRFQINGSVKLTIRDYRQDRMKIRILGKGEVVATGEAPRVEVSVAGTGDVDLGLVKAQTVKVDIAGSGRALIAPTSVAEVNIAGSGTVTLLTNPPTLKTRMAGSGRIIHAAPTGV